MFVNRYRASGQAVTPSGFLDLPALTPKGDGVIPSHYPVRLNAEYPVQIRVAGTPEGGSLLFRRDSKLPIELRHITFPQKCVGLCQRADPGQPQLLRQTPCQVPKFRSQRPRACAE
jgi:hypothetical protein